MLLSMDRAALLRLIWLLVLSATIAAHGDPVQGVTYDSRSLIINGKRELLFSGSIHYPRSTPDMWPQLISKAKHGGINAIQTYVFWNVHEPIQGQFTFEGRYDLVKFIKEIWKQGLYVILRIGPFIQAEWNYGGFPYWLREVPDITFRSDNEPFKHEMKKFTKMIVKMMKEEKLYASQGGPIVLSQIENEYNTIQIAFKDKGSSYVQWAGNMAVALGTGVPWVMCKQKDAPDPVINACNGRNCGDTFTGPNKPYKPVLWTENWTAQYRSFGDPPSQRSAEDLAYSVARFFSKNGTLNNYYMYHGGTNFGRYASEFVTTRYYDEAPLDEYGMQREPKWGHLRDLHSALRLCRKALLWGFPTVQKLGEEIEARIYQQPGTNVCAAFIANNHSSSAVTANFNGGQYYLPPHSISILPDCKTEVFNTQKVLSQHNSRVYQLADESNKDMEWKMYQDQVPNINHCSLKHPAHLEHINVSKDTSDYVWYTTRLVLQSHELPLRRNSRPIIQAASLGHGLNAFVNGVYIGSAHGDNVDKSFTFKGAAELKEGENFISLMSMTVGLPDSGVYLEHRLAGVHTTSVVGLNTGTLDLSSNEWGHKVGMEGEIMGIYTEEGSKKVEWSSAKDGSNRPLTWYKRYFDCPTGADPVALDLSSMSKGQAWVNGEGIGRYWVSFLSPLGSPSQTMYHIPRSFLKPTNNLLVIFEETGGDPHRIFVTTVNRDTICSFISENDSPHVNSWERKNSEIRAAVDNVKLHATLKCPHHKVIKEIEFASFGDPSGVCGNYTMGSCNHPEAKNVVEKACLDKTSCDVPITEEAFSGGVCSGITRTLAIQARCVEKKVGRWEKGFHFKEG
ncbi:beta-galactosidase 13-like [Magnolia sinica]|uniref:beta-galactosidase 13-like n=1 Tax=Magnolia sinica TaxID=86752 RepID=UPI002657BA6D|nr:beta-galactosidase 13-like [Magnolia sinica]